MKNLRSPLLKSLPAAAKPKRSHIPHRIVLILFIGAFIIIPALIIITRALPQKGAGFIFYWIHDHIFLPIKGYTYTLFYPYSLSWWGPVLTVFILWSVGYLAMVSFVKDPHTAVLRKVVRRGKRHSLLVKTSRWLKKWKLKPLLLKEVVNLERRTSLARLESLPLYPVNEPAVGRLVHLTQLHIDLITLPPVKKTRETYLEALTYWYEAYFQVRVRLQKNSQSGLLKELAERLTKSVETLLLPLLNYKDEAQLKEAMAQPAAFDITSAVVDLFYLASLNNSNLAILGQGSSNLDILGRLAASVTGRRILLEEIHRRLEKLQKQNPGPYDTGKSATFEPILEGLMEIDPRAGPTAAGTTISLVSRLAILIALDLSVLANSVSIGLGYMDTLEAYDFVFNGLELEEPPRESPYFTVLRSLNRLPEPGDYRLGAELAAIELEDRENLWKQSELKEDGTIKPGDFELAKSRVQSMFHAAGPGLDDL